MELGAVEDGRIFLPVSLAGKKAYLDVTQCVFLA
jgi:hypothetical protein